MAIVHEGSAPYAPAVQVIGAIAHYRNKGAAQFSKELLMRLGAPGPYANRTLSALKLLDLVDEEEAPTPAFTEIQRANEVEYKPRLEQVLRTAYDEVFQVVDPATASAQAVMDAFRFYQPVAQRDKMVTLFLALCEEAGIIGSDKAPRKRLRTTIAPNGRKRIVDDDSPNRDNGEVQTPRVKAPPPRGRETPLAGLKPRRAQ